MRRSFAWLTAIYRLELYEVIGIIASAAAITVFFVFARRLDDIIGISGYHWQIVNDVVGMYQSLITWVFTGVLSGLFVLLWFLRRQNHARLQNLAYLVRVLIALCIMMAIYKVVNFYISVFNPFDRDLALQRIDRWLFFGRLPGEWMEPMLWQPLTFLFSCAYMSWFVLTYATIFVMQTHSRRAVAEFVFSALATFYVGYFTYVLVPAIGPMYTVQFSKPIGGIADFFLHDQTLVARDCFPSLHTGISLVMLIQVWRYRRRWLWLYAPAALLIILSTMYLRFHYGIDVIAGAALAIVMTQLGPLAVDAWERKRAAYAATNRHQTAATESQHAVSELA